MGPLQGTPLQGTPTGTSLQAAPWWRWQRCVGRHACPRVGGGVQPHFAGPSFVPRGADWVWPRWQASRSIVSLAAHLLPPALRFFAVLGATDVRSG